MKKATLIHAQQVYIVNREIFHGVQYAQIVNRVG
jgi:hypothetical protein